MVFVALYDPETEPTPIDAMFLINFHFCSVPG
jgi:hypothetical protein